MNAARLREILDKLATENTRLRIVKRLSAVDSVLTNLISHPTDSSVQQQYVDALNALNDAMRELRASFQPAEIARIEDLSGGADYLSDIVGLISGWMAENPATPAVALDRVKKLIERRNLFLAAVSQGAGALANLGIEIYQLEPGEAEIGFLIPRTLFDNEFDKLIKELTALKRIIRAFSEAATGSAEPIAVKQISTTDPLFTFAMNAATIMLIGKTVVWALNAWKTVEEIRFLRAQTANLAAKSASKITDVYTEVIEETIEGEISSKLDEIVKSLKGEEPRRHEQRTDLEWALRSILARVERGMIVEIRMLPPPETESGDGSAPAEPPSTRAIRDVADSLVFPPVTGEPVLKIPSLSERKTEPKG